MSIYNKILVRLIEKMLDNAVDYEKVLVFQYWLSYKNVLLSSYLSELIFLSYYFYLVITEIQII